MRRVLLIFGLSFFVCPLFLFSQTRPLSGLFPGASAEQRNAAFSAKGYLYYGKRAENLTLVPQTGNNIKILKNSLGPNPGIFVEALRIIPRKNTGLLNIYNALERIQDLKGRTYYSHSGKKNMPLFTDATRIESPAKLKTFLPDPLPAVSVPHQETFYVRLTDIRFGNCFYEISLASSSQGILYKINNFKSVTYGPVPVMKEKTFTALLYIEQVEEGLAVYCLAGTEVSDFIAKHVDISSALNKRMDVFIAWLLDGIK